MELEFTKAKRSLEAAERAYQRLLNAKTLGDIDDSWESMIYALARVVKTVAVSSLKGDHRLAGLLTRMEKDRQGDDALVAYVYAARNAKDHRLEPISIGREASTVLKTDGPEVKVQYHDANNNTIIIHAAGPLNLIRVDGTDQAFQGDSVIVTGPGRVYAEGTPAQVKLLPVTNEIRGHPPRTLPVPQSHMGNPIEGELIEVAELALIYYRTKLQELLRAVEI